MAGATRCHRCPSSRKNNEPERSTSAVRSRRPEALCLSVQATIVDFGRSIPEQEMNLWVARLDMSAHAVPITYADKTANNTLRYRWEDRGEISMIRGRRGRRRWWCLVCRDRRDLVIWSVGQLSKWTLGDVEFQIKRILVVKD